MNKSQAGRPFITEICYSQMIINSPIISRMNGSNVGVNSEMGLPGVIVSEGINKSYTKRNTL